MGHLLAKVKIWREKNELSHEKAKQVTASPKGVPQEQGLVNMDSDRPLVKQQSTKELFMKLELIESNLENQRKVLQDHSNEIKEIKDTVVKVDRGIHADIGHWMKTLQLKLSGYEQLLKQQGENHQKLRKEVEGQLQFQQKLNDSLLAGVIVGFVIMVLICVVPRTLMSIPVLHL